MTIRPLHLNAYEFTVVSSLRAKQLLAGCTPRLPGRHSPTIMAQMEVAEGCVTRAADPAMPGEARPDASTCSAPEPVSREGQR